MTAPTLQELAALAEHTVEAVDAVVGNAAVQFGTGFVPVAGGDLVIVEKAMHAAAPWLEGQLKYMMAASGKTFPEVFAEWIAHGTSGLPNSPLVGPVPAVPIANQST